MPNVALTSLRAESCTCFFGRVAELETFLMQVINIGTEKLYPWGWRLSLGLAAVPATTLLLGGIFLDDTPNSLIERGYPEKVGKMLHIHNRKEIAIDK